MNQSAWVRRVAGGVRAVRLARAMAGVGVSCNAAGLREASGGHTRFLLFQLQAVSAVRR
jgi:hypothetical protein